MDYSLFQRLTESELDNTISEIDLALEFHIKWLSELNRALICHTETDFQQVQNILINDDHFIRWYNTMREEDLIEIPAFKALGEIHAEMLKVSRSLLSSVSQKESICSSEYDKLISLATELRQQINVFKSKLKSDLKLVAKLMGKVFENADEGVMITKKYLRLIIDSIRANKFVIRLMS